MASESARCPRCRTEVPVPATFAHGVMLGCKTCNSQLRLLRSDKGAIRLVVADAGPLRDQMAFNRSHVERLHADLKVARHSLGVGANGFGIGVAYVMAQIVLEERLLNQKLVLEAVVVAVVAGVLLELANYFFLAKRKTMTRLSHEIAQMREEEVLLQSLIREAERAQQQFASSSGSR